MSKFTKLVSLVKEHAVTSHPSTMIAQAMLESGLRPDSDKVSGLAEKYNNYFGMKAPEGYTGKVTPALSTQEDTGGGSMVTIQAGFKWYSSMEESVKDRERLIAVSPSAYRPVRQANTPDEECKALEGVYATDSKYAEKLIKLISDYDLKKYDEGFTKGVGKLSVTAKKVLDTARSYLGVTKGSSGHKSIIDGYNAVKPLPVGYAVKYSDDWCDAFVSFVGIKAGASGLIGRECGVERHKAIFRQMGIWRGLVKPQPGDIVIFHWGGDRNGFAHHIGFVEVVNGNTITTIEGNTVQGGVSKVGRNKFAWNDRRIQGYARPNYAKGSSGNSISHSGQTVKIKPTATHWQTGERIADSVKGKSFKVAQTKPVNQSNSRRAYLLTDGSVYIGWLLEQDVDGLRTVEEVAKEVIDGKWGNNPQRAELLARAGYNPAGVQSKVNELLKSDAEQVTVSSNQPVGGDERELEDNEFMIDGVVYVVNKK